jgi:putative oxidoreductase
MTLTFCGLALAVVGPGKWSLDQAFGWRKDLIGTTGLLIAIVAGAGGAALLLATSWRPRPAEA